MSLYLKLKPRLPEFNIELVTLNRLNYYEDIFSCNQEYFLITDGRLATRQDCIETIEYGKNFPEDLYYLYWVFFKWWSYSFAFNFWRLSRSRYFIYRIIFDEGEIQTKINWNKIISSIIDESFNAQYNTIKLSVQDNNISGCSFWRKLGFKVTQKCDCDNFCNLSMELKRYLKRFDNSSNSSVKMLKTSFS